MTRTSGTRGAPLTAALIVAALLLGIAGVAGCGADADYEETTPETDPGAASDEPTTTGGEDGPVYHVSEVEVTGGEVAVITTSKGVIEFEFFSEDAPNTVASFIELADAGFYDGTKFHRVEPGFVIQGGDPLSRTDDPMVGTGGPGYSLKAEFNDRKHLDGTVAMARSQDPDSAGSQFYICMGPQPFLDGQYTVFGQVTEGLDVVYQIGVGDVMESVTIRR